MITINKKILITVLSFVMIISIITFSTSADAAYLSNSFISRYVYDLENEDDFSFPLIYDVGYEKRINIENLFGKLNIEPRFEYDLISENEKMDIKEAYLDLYFSNYDLRIGKQKLTWGKSDGLVITNIVNPQDYTVNPIVEFSDQMQGVNGLKTTFYPNNDSFEMIVVPEFKETNMEESLITQNIPQGFTIDESEKAVDTNLENSELFLRYSSIGSKYDCEVLAGYYWNDTPTLHKDLVNKTVIPKHHRIASIGGSISTMAGPFILKGEGIFNSGKYYNQEMSQQELLEMTPQELQEEDGVVEKDQLIWMAGVDYSYEGYLFATQFKQEAILDYEENIIKDEFSNQMIFLVKKDFMRSKLNTEINFHYNINDEVLMTKPSISYDYSSEINFKAGANYNLEGENPKTDVIYLQTEYLF